MADLYLVVVLYAPLGVPQVLKTHRPALLPSVDEADPCIAQDQALVVPVLVPVILLEDADQLFLLEASSKTVLQVVSFVDLSNGSFPHHLVGPLQEEFIDEIQLFEVQFLEELQFVVDLSCIPVFVDE